MKQSTRPAAVTAAVILVLELAGAAFWGHAALHREAYARAYNLLPIAVLELAVQPLMLAGAAYLLLWALDRLFLSPYSWQKKTDVASKTRQGGALCPVGGWPCGCWPPPWWWYTWPSSWGACSAGCPADGRVAARRGSCW